MNVVMRYSLHWDTIKFSDLQFEWTMMLNPKDCEEVQIM